MNKFAFRFTRDGMNYHAEYRLAHWSSHRVVRDNKGKPMEFRNPMDAALKAAQELVEALNGNCEWWRGPDGSEARTAAEKLFREATRTTDGGEGKEG